MKLLLKLAIVALVANAAFRIGSEYVVFLKFRDGVRDAATFKAKTDEDLRRRVKDLASSYELPIEDDAVSIERENRQVHVTGSYTKPVEIVPRYSYPWRFSWTVDAVEQASSPFAPPAPSSAQ